ncbi:hypothetical protein Ancab_027399, partial [Ancistrocladus abbreviatus]
KLGEPKKRKAKKLCIGLDDVRNSSEKQRVARTVILSGLLNAEMAEEVLHCANQIDGVCFCRIPASRRRVGSS